MAAASQQFRPPQQPETGHSIEPPRRGGRSWWIAAAIASVVLTAVGLITAFMQDNGSGHGYQPQSFRHAHGTTKIDTEPHAVAAVGPNDGDEVLSLGVQPVTMSAPGGKLASWEQQLVTGAVDVASSADTGAIQAAKPDVIIATGIVDDATYNALATIAPTVTRPSDSSGSAWTWQNQMAWIGRIIGRDQEARQLIDAARSQQDDLRNQNPAFNGKTIAAINFSDNGVTATLVGAPVTGYLESLGFRYSEKLNRTDADTSNIRSISDRDLFSLNTDVIVVVRTDKAAGGGGYNGLPQPLTLYRGALVIVDDVNLIAALNTDSYPSIEYLNSNFVAALAGQVH